MNEPLSESAKIALSSPQFESLPHRSQRWLKQVIQHSFGDRFDAYLDTTPRATGLRFRKSPYIVPLEHGSQPGDILFKLTGSAGCGHAAIRLDDKYVAENSSIHWDSKRDARGIRTLHEFGEFDLIVRLPHPYQVQPRQRP